MSDTSLANNGMSDTSLANNGTSEMVTTAEVEEYCAAVRDALTDLPDEARDDLLEDLADHLAEVAAEGEGSLRERLGAPTSYALDLRSAAGYDAPVGVEPIGGPQERVVAAFRRASEAATRTDLRLGRLVGYPRLSQLALALAPGWWVLRGWIVAQLICADRSREFSFSPAVGDSRLAGGLITFAIIVVSVLVGRRTGRWSAWPRRIAYAASAAVAIWGVLVLAPFMVQTPYTIETVPASSPYDGVNDLYVYDQNGNLVPNARIYDQAGNPVQLGNPDDPNRPFPSGPGEVAPAASASASASTPTTEPTAPASAGSSTTP